MQMFLSRHGESFLVPMGGMIPPIPPQRRYGGIELDATLQLDLQDKIILALKVDKKFSRGTKAGDDGTATLNRAALVDVIYPKKVHDKTSIVRQKIFENRL